MIKKAAVLSGILASRPQSRSLCDCHNDSTYSQGIELKLQWTVLTLLVHQRLIELALATSLIEGTARIARGFFSVEVQRGAPGLQQVSNSFAPRGRKDTSA